MTHAATADAPPETVLQVALTREGLQAIGVPADIVAAFPYEFLQGMGGNPARSRRLGDTGASDPWHWRWGAGSGCRTSSSCSTPGRAGWPPTPRRSARSALTASRSCSPRHRRLDGIEPFGFADGISQPEPDWARSRPVRDETRLDYGNLACLGEFVLGYPNEYGLYTAAPAARPGARAGLPRAEDEPALADLGRNGSYLVLRQLAQDVPAFWRCLDEKTGGDPALRLAWAEAMVGRKMSGTPLVDLDGSAPAVRGAAPPRDERNDFTYRGDPDGVRCPFGAHIRRANPRNADLPEGRGGRGLLSRLVRILGFDALAREQDRIASTRFHRLLRRGREYGPPLTIEQALAGDDGGAERGLHFVCLGADIGRQFEFVQAAWLASPKFDGLSGERDPLLGRRDALADGTPGDFFSWPRADGADRRLSGLRDFVTVVGGAYFFLPGIRALRFLASAR